MTASDFEAIYWPYGTCTFWDCDKQGIILAYDDFCPEVAHWFCEDHWPEYSDIFIVVERQEQSDGDLERR